MTNKTADERDELELAPARPARQPGSHSRTPSDWSRRARTFDLKPRKGLYEHRDQPPLSRWQFAQRMARHAAAGAVVVMGSIVFGMWGYHRFAGFSWGDAFVNAAMLLGGMGPVGVVVTRTGRLFAGLFALYSAMIFLVLIAIVMTPIIHRIIHRFHWDMDQRRGGSRNAPE